MIINAMTPARMGSSRLKQKNLALINGKPMVSYALNAAKSSSVFSSIFLNSENDIFSSVAKRFGVKFYKRQEELGSSHTKSDDVVYDFMTNIPGDITVWVNSTSPLQTGKEIKEVVEYFIENNLDSLITVREEQVHCTIDGKPINYSPEGKFAQTQDLSPISRFVYSIMMWKNKTFIQEYNLKGDALMCGKFGTYPVSKETSLIIKSEEDLELIHRIVSGRENSTKWSLEYDEIAKAHT